MSNGRLTGGNRASAGKESMDTVLAGVGAWYKSKGCSGHPSRLAGTDLPHSPDMAGLKTQRFHVSHHRQWYRVNRSKMMREGEGGNDHTNRHAGPWHNICCVKLSQKHGSCCSDDCKKKESNRDIGISSMAAERTSASKRQK